MTDVGDAIEITFTGRTGAVVAASWIDPAGTAVMDNVAVDESPAGSGRYPITVLGQSPGVWTARFRATGTITAVENYYQSFTDPTGPPPLASLDEYIDMFGPLSAARQSTCKVLLRRASQLVRDRYPGIDAKIGAGTVPGNAVALSVLNMVSRVMRNPQGLRSASIGPVSRSFDEDASSGWLTFSDADAALIDPAGAGAPGAAAGAKGKAGTIRLRAGLAPRSYGGWYG